MISWRALVRIRSAAAEILSVNSKLGGQVRCASRLTAVCATSSSAFTLTPSHLSAAQRVLLRGFAASSASPPDSSPPSPPVAPVPVEAEALEDSSSESEAEDSDLEGSELENPNPSTDGPVATGQLQVPTIDGVSQQEEDDLLKKIQSSSKKHQRHILQQLLTGNELASTSATGAEEDAAELAKKQETYSLKLVDVNSTNKGTKSGGVQSFSAMVVVGNHDGLLGHGTGKAAELVAAIRKASLRAMNNLSYVPRYERFTILHPVDTKYGKCKLRMYPMASGRGIRANTLMSSIADLAGINAIGIKTHGTRNARNSVKALFQAFGQLTTIERRAQELGLAAVEVVAGSRPTPNPSKHRYAQRLSR